MYQISCKKKSLHARILVFSQNKKNTRKTLTKHAKRSQNTQTRKTLTKHTKSTSHQMNQINTKTKTKISNKLNK